MYDSILPASIAYKPFITDGNIPKVDSPFEANRAFDGYSEPPEGTKLMPLVKFLREGRLNKELGWHRIAERNARGLPPLPKLKVQLEAWERQLVSYTRISPILNDESSLSNQDLILFYPCRRFLKAYCLVVVLRSRTSKTWLTPGVVNETSTWS